MMIQQLEQGKDLPKISILRALQILVSSWDKVTKKTLSIVSENRRFRKKINKMQLRTTMIFSKN